MNNSVSDYITDSDHVLKLLKQRRNQDRSLLKALDSQSSHSGCPGGSNSSLWHRPYMDETLSSFVHRLTGKSSREGRAARRANGGLFNSRSTSPAKEDNYSAVCELKDALN